MLIKYGPDCPCTPDKKHEFIEYTSLGLHCQKCYLFISIQEECYDGIVLHREEK